jgi:signal transduction histidine kinase/ActR/RegA family two-component response regulator
MPRQQLQLSTRRLAIGFLALAISVASATWLVYRQQRAVEQVTHTLEVNNKLAGILSLLQGEETGQRGYLLTGSRDFLEPYDNALANIDPQLDDLQVTTSDNPTQQEFLSRLRSVASQRHALLNEMIVAHGRGDPIDTSRLNDAKALMDEIRSISASMQAEENRLLAIRTSDASSYWYLILGALLGSAVLTCVIATVTLRSLRQRFMEIAGARDSLAATNRQLEHEALTRKTAEAQVRQMQKIEAVGQLTGGIAHDFNNMLAIIVGSLELAKRRLTGSEDARVARGIQNAMEGAQRAAQLTARLLAFSRQQPLAPQVCDLNKLISNMSELLRRSLGEAIEIEAVSAGGLWRCYCDLAQTEQAILNLCVNARDAMPDGGKLTIETSNASLDDSYAAANTEVAAGQYVLLSVTDTGSGMSEDVIERAFDPFYTTKAVGKGTGLGLSQVHGFIKQSKGHVKIYSEVGRGTTVKIYLPRHYGDELDVSARAVSPATSARARAGETILVVEDDEQVRQATVEMLRELGYLVLHATDAAHALKMLPGMARVDLLFTDVVMPGMSGRQLATRAAEILPNLKVLYTTGYTRNAVIHNGVLDRDVAFIAKPFTILDLAAKVRQVLDAAQTTG